MEYVIIRSSDLCFVHHWCVREWKIEAIDVYNDKMYGFDSRGIKASKYTECEVKPLLDWLKTRFPNELFTAIPKMNYMQMLNQSVLTS